ncbi:MAG: hypothetical protein L6Q99_18220 [Planctomycetes bacterium]|nr:hypothetical protein [Planctomycetota bacterium]
MLVAIVALVSVLSNACGPYPPSVADRSDVDALPIETRSLHARRLRDDDLPSLARLVNLELLDFTAGFARNDLTTGFEPRRAAITDRGLAKLAALELPSLRTLHLSYCEEITDVGMADVARMQQLERLSLRATSIGDEGLRALVRLENLRHLDLAECAAVTDRGLEILARKSNWEALFVRSCPNVTEAAIERLQAELPDCFVN